MLKKIILGIVGVFLVMFVILFSQTKVPYESFDAKYLSVSDMKADISQLEKDFMKSHPVAKENPDLYKAFFNDLSNAIDSELTNSEFSTVLAVKLATLNDAHTSTVPVIDGPTLPLLLKIMDGEFLVLKGYSELEVGDRIISIGGVDIQTIYDDYSRQHSAENTYWKQELFEEIYIELNKVIGLGGRKTLLGGMRIKYKTQEETKTITLFEDDFIYGQYNDSIRNEILYNTLDSKTLVESSYPSFKYFIDAEKDYVYYQIRECTYNTEFTKMTDQVFDEVERTKTKNLVIDLRGNWGGTSEVMDYFTTRLDAYNRYLSRLNSAAESSMNLLILVDHKTFSAALDFACAMKDGFNGTIIGQPTGGTLPCYGNSYFAELNNSKIWYAISQNYYNSYDKPIVKNDSIYPDIVSNYDIHDYANGIDKDLEIVERLVDGN